MKEHSSEFKENLISIGREVDNIITYDEITLHDELYKVDIVYEGGILKSVMKELDIESSVDIPKGTILNYKMGIKVGNDYEYLDYGNYVVYSSERQEDEMNYKIVCYDKLLYSMVDYEDVGIQYPITIRDYIIAICEHLGIEFANAEDEFANYDRQILSERYLTTEGESLEYTFRDVLDELAEVTASTICINKDDKLEIRYIEEIPTTNNTAEGTSIEINDAIEHKIINYELEGDIQQDSTTGKQLFNINDLYVNPSVVDYVEMNIDKNILTLTATGTRGAQYVRCDKSGFDNTKTYNLSFKSKKIVKGTDGYPRISFFIYGSNDGSNFTLTKQFTNTDPVQGTEYSFNGTVTGYSYYRFFIYNNNSTPVTIGEQTQYWDIMFNEGNTALPYEPYTNGASPNPDYPQDIKVVSGEQNIKVSNKNILGIKEGNFTFSNYARWNIYQGIIKLSISNIEEQGGCVDLTDGYTTRWASGGRKDYHLTEDGGTYTFSVYRNGDITYSSNMSVTPIVAIYLMKYNSKGEYIGNDNFFVAARSINQDLITKTITLNSGEHIGCLRLYSAFIECENVEFKIQLEKGSTATDYIEHQEQTQLISLMGKNLLNVTATTQTTGGVTCTINADKAITLNGTSTTQVEIDIGNCGILKAGTYIGNCENNSSTSTYYIRLGKAPTSSSTWIANVTKNSSITLSEDTSVYATIIIKNNVTLNNVTLYPQIEKRKYCD